MPWIWPVTLPRHTWPTAQGFYFIATVALESKATLGLTIPYKATVEQTTIYKGSGFVLGLVFWERTFYKRRDDLWPTVDWC